MKTFPFNTEKYYTQLWWSLLKTAYNFISVSEDDFFHLLVIQKL